jgi:actin-related protein
MYAFKWSLLFHTEKVPFWFYKKLKKNCSTFFFVFFLTENLRWAASTLSHIYIASCETCAGSSTLYSRVRQLHVVQQS